MAISKKVMLIIVDALASRVVQALLDQGKLPNMQALVDAGQMYEECTSIFPSVTLAATPSITTGVYPKQHGMMGAYWYEQSENRVVYFGADSAMVFRQGLGTFLTDFLVRLNERWLDAKTIFEQVEAANRTAASINWFVYHGHQQHEIDLSLLHLVPNAPAAYTIWGPTTLHLGDFTTHSKQVSDDKIGADGGPTNRMGFIDEISCQLLTQLIKRDALPDFTLAYFPDNDFNSHEVGPENARETVQQFDRYLGEMIEAYGGLDALLENVAILITGDHAQSNIVDDESMAAIDLTKVMPNVPAAEVGKGFSDDVDVVLCPNGRVASIYLRHVSEGNVNHIIECLIAEERVDQVIVSEGYLGAQEDGYHVFTQERGELHFGRTNGEGEETLIDRYGTKWYWRGNLAVFGETEERDGETFFPDYPNPMERIANLLDSPRSAHIWVTAKVGYDFVIPGIEAHTGGGSHGSLHALDSIAPLLVAGLPEGVTPPRYPRLVDLLPLSLQVLGIEQAHAQHEGNHR